MSSTYSRRLRIITGLVLLVGLPIALEDGSKSASGSTRGVIAVGGILIGFGLIMSSGGL